MGAVGRPHGARSRNAILARALRFTAASGLHSATIGALAEAMGMSKSGVFAHFGSKDALDVAVVAAAADRFIDAVAGPAAAAPPGITRLVTLCEAFLAYASPAAGDEPHLTPSHAAFGVGSSAAVRLRLGDWHGEWQRLLTASVAEAIAQGEMARGTDPGQVAFEVQGLLEAAAAALRHEPAAVAVARARQAIDRVLLAFSVI